MGLAKDIASANIVGYTVSTIAWKLAMVSKDVVVWLREAADSENALWLTREIKQSVDAYLAANPADRSRKMVAVGYSGGFLPLVEGIVKNAYVEGQDIGYNVATLVALGAATMDPQAGFTDLLVKLRAVAGALLRPAALGRALVETLLNIASESLSDYGVMGVTNGTFKTVMDYIDRGMAKEAYDEYRSKIESLADEMGRIFKGFALESLTHTNTNLFVNIYGSKDLLTSIGVNGNKIGGYRSQMGGFIEGSLDRPLVNIEIVGASHFDYMRNSVDPLDFLSWSYLLPSERNWNETVSSFVATLVGRSKDSNDLQNFLSEQEAANIARQVGNKWIIELPGSSNR